MRKEIKNYSNYLADDAGFILKPSRIAKDKRSGEYTKEIILKPKYTPNGYQSIQLWNNSKVVNKLVHVLVWETFTGLEKPKNMDLDHIDGNKNNNSFSNLELVTRSENMKRASKLGLLNTCDKYKIEACLQLIKNGFSMTQAAKDSGISRDTIKRIRKGVGAHVEYTEKLNSILSSKR